MTHGPSTPGQRIPTDLDGAGDQQAHDPTALVGVEDLPTQLGAEEVSPISPEFEVGGCTYTYDGPMAPGFGYAFTSTDETGAQRKLFLWQSGSESGLRVSFGIQRKTGDDGITRSLILKGGGRADPMGQYTQDTQPHPEFERHAAAIVGAVVLPPMGEERTAFYEQASANTEALYMDPDTASAASAEFAAELTHLSLGSEELDTLLRTLKAGQCGLEDMRTIVGDADGTAEEVWSRYTALLDRVNELLVAEGLVPDFTAPPVRQQMQNGIMGDCVAEVFEHTTPSGMRVEWYMARDPAGNVWVHRIRLADATATPYGTDREMITSGALTTKPLDFGQNADGIPESLRPQFNPSYCHMSAILDRLAPIARYKDALAQRSTAVAQ